MFARRIASKSASASSTSSSRSSIGVGVGVSMSTSMSSTCIRTKRFGQFFTPLLQQCQHPRQFLTAASTFTTNSHEKKYHLPNIPSINSYSHSQLYSHSYSQSYSTTPNTPTSESPSPQQLEPTTLTQTPLPPPFKKILIANRGEIARRIIKTCHLQNIPTVAIYSTSDMKSPHVQEATEAICVGPTSSSDSYLCIDHIMEAVRVTGADAIHPGYGFLSENYDFVRFIEDMNIEKGGGSGSGDGGDGKNGNDIKKLTFIGPNSEAIIAMGDKITSKQIAKNANVNIIPGYDGILTSSNQAIQLANDVVGYPVMIKATAGGGGKGMRICYNDDEVKEAFVLSTAEAKKFFNDDRLFIEKYIENPHHIEIQLLAGYKKKNNGNNDNNNNNNENEKGELEILCFPERECSIQRRNQKILEESPSTILTPTMRSEMIRQVKRLVRTVNYTSAGTVEFLVDAKSQQFYFLEMNTRLQVEHPVTEMVSSSDGVGDDDDGVNVDLVHGMIEIAAGRGIPKEYMDLVRNGYDCDNMTEDEIEGLVVPPIGHAIEARIYAEDPIRGFLPSTGPLTQYIEPPTTLPSTNNHNKCKIRVDSGVLPGSIISQYYDPMISKLISYSPNSRKEAIEGLQDAIDRYVIRGIEHNSSFLQDVLRNKTFIDGVTPTNFIDIHYPDGYHGVQLTSKERAELAAVAAAVSSWRREYFDMPPLTMNGMDRLSASTSSSSSSSSSNNNDGEELVVCIGGMFGKASLVNIIDGKIIVKHMAFESDVEVSTEAETEVETDHEIIIDSIEYDPTTPIVDVVINGVRKAIQIQNEDNSGVFNTQYSGANLDCLVMSTEEYKLSRHMKEPKVLDTSNLILSPMPGTLVSYAVEDGEEVLVGQEICVVEAMKMQNVLRSTRSGIIKKCHADLGGSLMTDEMIVEFEEDEDV